MIQCPVCQVSNEPNSQFCRECGNRIERRLEPRPKLKSPLLSGYEEPETYDEEPNVSKLRGVKPSKAKNPGEKPKLRSPLLGDDEDDESWDNTPQEERRSSVSNTGKNKLRSPLLGDGDDNDDDFDSPSSGSSTGMPRVRRKPSALNPSMSPGNQDTGNLNTGNQSGKGGKPKLRSRLLDTSDYEEYDDDWDEDEDKEDAQALRSPLLRARTHLDDKPERTVPPQPKAQAPAPVPTTPMSPINPMNQANSMNPPASIVPPSQAPIQMPMQQAQQPAQPPQPQTAPSPHNPPSPTSSGIFAQQPSFQPPNLPAPTPEVPNQKPLQMPGQPDENYLPPPIPQREAIPPIPHPMANQPKPGAGEAETGPDDRRTLNRRQSTTDRRSRSGLLGASASNDMDDDYAPTSRAMGPSMGAEQLKIVCLASICAVVFKVVYIGYVFISFGLTPTSLWIILDQLAFIFVCVGLIMYSSKGMSNR